MSSSAPTRLPKPLIAALEKFLATRSKSSGGYAPVADKDIEDLNRIVRLLIEKKYEPDPDGDLPVTFRFIDRTKYQGSHFLLIPHLHSASNEATPDAQAAFRAIEAAHVNLQMAQDQLRQTMHDFQFMVMEPMAAGREVRAGERVYQQSHPYGIPAMGDLLLTEARAYLKKVGVPALREATEAFDRRDAFTNPASTALSKKMGLAVQVKIFTGSRAPHPWRMNVEMPGHGVRVMLKEEDETP